MRVLSFSISGPMAHFKKFYTNSTSLTYDFPPRTVVEGIIASIIGYEKDSYYELLDSEKVNIGISIESASKKILQTINYIKIKSPNDIYAQKDHTQTPIEYLIPSTSNSLKFDIYVNAKNDLLDILKENIVKNKSEFPVFLGIANCIGSVSFNFDTEANYTKDIGFIEVSSIIPSNKIIKIDYSKLQPLLKDRIPVDFNNKREIKKVLSVVYVKNGGTMKIKYNDYIAKLKDKNIVFIK